MSPAGEGGLAVFGAGEDALVLAQGGEGGLPPIVMLALVAGISFLGFRWVFRGRSRHHRQHEGDEATGDGGTGQADGDSAHGDADPGHADPGHADPGHDE